MSDQVRLVERMETLAHFVGDSHTIIFNGLVFEDRVSNKQRLTRADHHRYFLAHEVSGWGDKIEERLWRSLLLHDFLGYVPPEHGSKYLPKLTTTQCGAKIEEGLAAGFMHKKPLVLMCGEIDTRNILSQFKAGTDVELPFAAPQLEALAPFAATRLISADEILAFMRREFAPLFTGLRILKEIGLENLFLHSIPPPALDDDDAERVLTFRRAARVRYKIALLVNWLYAQACADLGIGFLNIWDAVCKQGLLNQDFYLDGLHLNKKAAIVSVNCLHASLSGSPMTYTHPLLDEALTAP